MQWNLQNVIRIHFSLNEIDYYPLTLDITGYSYDILPYFHQS